jgi:Mg-chelatase subunit ChlD
MTKKAALTFIAAAMLLASCRGPESDPSGKAAATVSTTAPGGRWLGGDADRNWDEARSDRSGAESAALSAGGASTAKPAAAPVPGAPYGDDVAVVPPERQGPGLRAGSTDDNAAFADYLKYRDDFKRLGIAVRDFDVSVRHVVTVVDENGKPLLGAAVRAGDQEVRTAADGRALLFGDVASATIHYGDRTATADFSPDTREHRVTFPITRAEERTKLDVLFLIDTTGSMDDEIDRLKESVRSVAGRISELPADADLRLAMTVYRDRGDLFVTRTFDFTPDVGVFQNALAAVQAGGGGDTPEDLNAGLHEAVTAPAWRGDDTVKLVFLIADAPPHLDYQDGPDYAADVRTAARKGIKIMPIASSGLDDQGEYVFRQMAQATMGRFTFLTYGADGVSPGDLTDHHVSDYAVLALDDLVVRLVADELKPLSAGGQ